MALPELDGWQAESLRVTFFANEPVIAAGKNWWQAATGSAPEVVVSKQNASEHSESGPFGCGQLEMKVVFNRVDWLYTPRPVMIPGPTPPFLGSASDVLDSLHDPLTSWLSANEAPYVRIAFGAALFHEVSDISDANRAVMAYLPFIHIDPVKARDIFFQINAPYSSTAVDGLLVNRISRFMCLTAQVFTMSVAQGIPIINKSYYCRAELDFNTAAERTETIPVDRCADVMRELAAACRETMSGGVQL